MQQVWEGGGRPVNLNAASPARTFVHRLGHWLLPARCLLCEGDGEPGRDLCAACLRDLPWNDRACRRCALPLPQPAAACGQCLRDPPPFSMAVAPLRYEAPADRLLTAFKFRGGLAQGRLLAELIVERVPALDCTDIDLVVPMPLHRQRLGQRGYNQALELARPVARAWNLPVAANALTRRRATAPQSDLDAIERRRNLHGAFVADASQVGGRRILLIDDVVTTGATVREAGKTLRAAGAVDVRVLAVARAPLKP